jgi:hypothetical protein
MNSQSGTAREVLRNPALMKRVPFLVGFLVVLGFLQGDDRGTAMIFWVAAAIALVFSVRPSLTIAPEGLIVSNMLARRYLWDDIIDIEDHPRLYGSTLRLQLKNGRPKYAWAVASGKGRWGADWIDETIARVRARWQLEATPSLRSAGRSPYLPREQQSFWARGSIEIWTILALMVFFIGLGTYITWDAVATRPAVYETLEQRGVKTDARVDYHEVGFSGRDNYYSLTVTFRGGTYSTHYHNNYKQFESVQPGDTVPALVDPENPEVIYTVADVHEGTNAGFGVLAAFGIAMTIAGLYGLVYFIRLWWGPDRD